jgi:hypothetical protein
MCKLEHSVRSLVVAAIIHLSENIAGTAGTDVIGEADKRIELLLRKIAISDVPSHGILSRGNPLVQMCDHILIVHVSLQLLRCAGTLMSKRAGAISAIVRRIVVVMQYNTFAPHEFIPSCIAQGEILIRWLWSSRTAHRCPPLIGGSVGVQAE